jgi:hypothetical protein
VRTVERKPGESPALKLTEVLNYTAPGELDQYLEINHPAVLWVLDADKDGMFGEEDIHSFAWMMGEYTKDWEQYQVRADTRPLVRDPPNPRQIIKLLTNPRPLPAQWRDQIKGFCYMQLYDRILSNDGKGGDSVQNATMAPQWLKDLEATRPPAPDDPSNPAAGLGVPEVGGDGHRGERPADVRPRRVPRDGVRGTGHGARPVHDVPGEHDVGNVW